MNRDFVIVHVFINDNLWPADHTSTDDVKGGLDTGCDTGGDITIGWQRVEIGEELVGIKAWTIVISVSPIPLVLALGHVGFTQATTACPPASTTLSSGRKSRGVFSCTARNAWVWSIVGNGVAFELFEPFLNLWRVCRWCESKIWPSGWYDCICLGGRVQL